MDLLVLVLWLGSVCLGLAGLLLLAVGGVKAVTRKAPAPAE
jgi:hypothetical protein